MKRFYIIANPEYFKKTMNWDMKHNDIKYTEDNLVASVASENVPVLLSLIIVVIVSQIQKFITLIL